MDVLPNGGIFKELQLVHDTGYFSSACSLEEHWQQVRQLLPLDSRGGLPDSAARVGDWRHSLRHTVKSKETRLIPPELAAQKVYCDASGSGNLRTVM
ncbi:hypothetical protein O3P69_020523 [Scylla paramamosain]|uniref:Krueppel-like factor 7 n=1 Tax=Scylla paramamosain TaxID=85552 RepID=A0AAW0TLH3_SCYPA